MTLFVVAAVLLVWSIVNGLTDFSWLWVFAAIVALIVAGIGGIGWQQFVASVAATGWRVRWSHDRLYIRFRSYLNRRFPPSTLLLARDDIVWLRPFRASLSMPTERGSWTRSKNAAGLEIGLRDSAPAHLDDILAAETARRDAAGRRYNDVPVVLTHDGTLKVFLRRPELVLARLAGRFPVLEEASTMTASFDDMDQDQRADHVRALVRAGEIIAAVKAARAAHGLSLADARKFVEDLQARDFHG